MAKAVELDISEWEKYFEDLERVNADLKQAKIEFMRKVSLLYLNRVKKKTNVDTGLLRRGWKVRRPKAVGDDVYFDAFNNIEYVEYVNYGHIQWTKELEGEFAYWVEGYHFKELTDIEIEKYINTQAQKFYNNYFKEKVRGIE